MWIEGCRWKGEQRSQLASSYPSFMNKCESTYFRAFKSTLKVYLKLTCYSGYFCCNWQWKKMKTIFPSSSGNLFSFAICQHPKDINHSLQPYSQATLLLGQKTTECFHTVPSNPVNVDSEVLTRRLPHSLFPCPAKMMLTALHTQKELGPSNISRFSLPSVMRTHPSQDLISQ